MKTLVCLSLLGLCSALVNAQEPGVNELRRDTTHPSMTRTMVTQTPEMWFYEQERSRYEDPKAAVRRNAEHRAAQRQSRIESMKWFGLSNIRPSATSTPVMGTYSPMWTSNSYNPMHWQGGNRQATLILRPGVALY